MVLVIGYISFWTIIMLENYRGVVDFCVDVEKDAEDFLLHHLRESWGNYLIIGISVEFCLLWICLQVQWSLYTCGSCFYSNSVEFVGVLALCGFWGILIVRAVERFRYPSVTEIYLDFLLCKIRGFASHLQWKCSGLFKVFAGPRNWYVHWLYSFLMSGKG